MSLMVSVAVIGCAKKNASIPTNTSVTDLTPAPAPAYQPQAQPAAQPVVYDSMTTAPESGGAVAGGSYTVKKGDTLYSIARGRYGDGKQWQRIAAANPGIEPSKLRVGQTIVIP
jgi:5'-nucleotidase